MQASSGGLLGRFKSLFNLSEASNPQNPSPNDVSKDIANRLGGGGGMSAIDEQSPGARMITSKIRPGDWSGRRFCETGRHLLSPSKCFFVNA